MQRATYHRAAIVMAALISCATLAFGLEAREGVDAELLGQLNEIISGAAKDNNEADYWLGQLERRQPPRPTPEPSAPEPSAPAPAPKQEPPPRVTPPLPLHPAVIEKIGANDEAGLRQLIRALDAPRRHDEGSARRQDVINYLATELDRRRIEAGGNANPQVPGSENRVRGIRAIDEQLGETYRQALGQQKQNEISTSQTGAVYEGSNRGRPADIERQPGTPFFSQPDVRRMHDPAPGSPGRTDPRNPPPKVYQAPDDPRQDAGTTRRTGTPPSPQIPGGGVSMAPALPVKGVRIQFHPAALAAARIRSRTLDEIESALTDGASPESWRNALAQYTMELAGKIEAQVQTTTLADATVVSLAAVSAEAGKYVDDWSRLPAHLRNPGPLRRIFGYAPVVDKETGEVDLLLLGTSEGNGRPIDLDDLIVGLAAAWRDGDVPFCSLEPDPTDFHRPHRSIVSGVPKNSRFAQVMLAADYDMKKVTNGRLPVDVEGFVNLATAVKRDLSRAAGFNSRMWFTPIQPAPGEIQVSSGGAVTLFHARMQILSEAMTNSGGGLSGTGRTEAVVDEVCRFMTEHLPEFERSVPSYAELHGLFDVVLLGQLLRNQDIRPAVLDRLVSLPTQKHDVPESFPAQNVVLEIEGFPIGQITGGVRMQLALRPDLIAVREDPRLERSVEGVRRDRTSQTLDGAELPIVTSAGGQSRQGESAHVAVDRLIVRGRSAEATAAASELIQDDPMSPELYALRGEAYRSAGLFWLADRDLQTAERLSGGNETYRIRRLQVYLERGSVENGAALSEADRGRMADEYLAAAARWISAGSLKAAERMLTRAMELAPERWQPPLLRAGIRMDAGDSEGALKDLEIATKLSEGREEVVFVRAKYALLQGRFPDALADADLLLKANPQSVDGYALRAQARFGAAGSDALAVPEDAVQDLERALRLAPRNPDLHVLRSKIALLEGDADGAFAAASNAIRFSPGQGEGYFLRAMIRAGISGVFDSGQADRVKVSDFESVLADLNSAVQFTPKPVKARQTRVAILGIVLEKFATARSAESWRTSPSFMKQLFQTFMCHEECLAPMGRIESLGEAKTEADLDRLVAALRGVIGMAAIGDLRQIAELTGDAKLRELVRARIQQMSQPQ